MNELTYLAISAVTLILIAILCFKYLDGDFTYADTVVERKKYTKTVSNLFLSRGTTEEVYRILIERRYLSGKIKFITKEIPA